MANDKSRLHSKTLFIAHASTCTCGSVGYLLRPVVAWNVAMKPSHPRLMWRLGGQNRGRLSPVTWMPSQTLEHLNYRMCRIERKAPRISFSTFINQRVT